MTTSNGAPAPIVSQVPPTQPAANAAAAQAHQAATAAAALSAPMGFQSLPPELQQAMAYAHQQQQQAAAYAAQLASSAHPAPHAPPAPPQASAPQVPQYAFPPGAFAPPASPWGQMPFTPQAAAQFAPPPPQFAAQFAPPVPVDDSAAVLRRAVELLELVEKHTRATAGAMMKIAEGLGMLIEQADRSLQQSTRMNALMIAAAEQNTQPDAKRG